MTKRANGVFLKRALMCCIGVVSSLPLMLLAALPDGGPYKEIANGIEWTFYAENGRAVLGTPVEEGSVPAPCVDYDTQGEIVVPTTLGGRTVTRVGDYAFAIRAGVTSIEIPSTVTAIGDGAFENCTSLASVKISTSVTRIGCNAFSHCTQLTTVQVPSSVTQIGNSAFSHCSNLLAINVDENNANYASENGILYSKDYSKLLACPGVINGVFNVPEGVQDVGDSAFRGCAHLTAINVAATVTNIGEEAFSYCEGLTTMNLPNSVCALGDSAFSHCVNLEYVALSTNITKVGNWAFEHCANLTTLVLPQGVKSLGDWAFGYCENLNNVVLPDGLTTIGSSAFYKCASLTEMDIPESVTQIGGSAFDGCVCLPFILIPKSVNSIGEGAFARCSTLLSITVDRENTAYASKNGVLYDKNYTTLFAFPGRFSGDFEMPTSVTRIGDSAFDGCDGLTSVSMPAGITSIGKNAFYGCVSLTTITIPSSVTQIGAESFWHCDNLVAIKFLGDAPKINALTTDDGLFYGNNYPVLYVNLRANNWPAEGETWQGCVVHALTCARIGLNATSGTCAQNHVWVEAGTELGVLPVPTRNGYTFTGWFTKASGGEQYEEDRIIYGDTSLYAQWTKNVTPVEPSDFSGGVGTKVSYDTGLGGLGYKASGLPSGLKFDAKTGIISGTPTVSGVFIITFTAKGQDTVVLECAIDALPASAVGKFNGFVLNESGLKVGTVLLTTTTAGKISVKVTFAAGTASYSATGWDSVKDGVYSSTFTSTTRNGETLTLIVDTKANWDAYQLTGSFISNKTSYSLTGQRNAFASAWYFTATGDEKAGWTLGFASDSKTAALTVTLKADGTLTLSGKLGSYRISSSSYADVSGLTQGAILADFVPFVTIKGTKKALPICINLWFDQKNDHAEGVGFAQVAN